MPEMTTPARFLALDALRGLTIAMMILVNTPGSWEFVYPPFMHADWHGCSPTDLVFPFFLFVVGSAMYFSLQKVSMQLSPAIALMIVRRSAIIFVLGLIFNAVLGGWEHLRIMGVLQRIALAYAIAAFIVLSLKRHHVYIIGAFLLVGYWLLLVIGGSDNPFNLTQNIVVKLDVALLGAEHMYNGKGVPFDPEGLLSTLPAVVNVLIGFELTRFLVAQQDRMKSLFILLILGLAGITLGLLWSIGLPINKSLWTSSFVIYSAGYFCIALALFVWLVDIKQFKRLAQPFIIGCTLTYLSLCRARAEISIAHYLPGLRRCFRPPWRRLYLHCCMCCCSGLLVCCCIATKYLSRCSY
jgi:predicted acyltransferase